MNRAPLAALILILGGGTACATSNAATQFGTGSVTLRIGDQQQYVEEPLTLSGELSGLLRRLCARHRPAVLLVTHDVEEAIVLADRIVVLSAAGRLDAGVTVHLPRPRRRDTAEFGALRGELLGALGVTEAA